MSGTRSSTEHQEEALEEPQEQPVDEVQPLPVLASSASSLNKVVSSEATSPRPDDYNKTYLELLESVVSDLGIQVEELRESSHLLVDKLLNVYSY